MIGRADDRRRDVAAESSGSVATGPGGSVAAPPVADPHGGVPEVADQETRAWGIVAIREIVVKLTDRNFLVSTGLTLLLLIGIMGFNAFMASRESTKTVAVVDQAGAATVEVAAAQLRASEDMTTLRSTTYPDDGAARAAVENGDAQAYLHRGADGWTMTSESQPDNTVRTLLADAVRTVGMQENLAAAGTTWEQVTAGTQLHTESLTAPESQERAESQGLRMITGFVFAMLFYMAALMFGMGIAQSVVEEKQSRVVEILATAIPIRQLLMGKVIGNTLLAVAQMALFVGVGLLGLSFTQYRSYLSVLSGPSGWFLLFFLIGFLSLACVWAVAGSLASRHEDLQSTTMPMTILLVIVLFVGISATGTWLLISSYVPVISTITMPMRLMEGSATWWEAAISLAITMVFASVTVLIGERLYRRSVMQTGGRRTLRQTLRAAD